jgi:translation initiation factor IF-3
LTFLQKNTRIPSASIGFLDFNSFYIAKRFRTNDRIRAKTVRLIDQNDDQKGIMGTQKALEMAKEAGLDLVEVSPNAHPPVCRLMDFGKFLYRQKKLDQKHKSKQKKNEVKGIRLSLRTGQHDLEVKIKRARKFLEQGNSLKVALIFRGREVTQYDLAVEKMMAIKEGLKDIAKCDQEPKKQGYNLFMILSPLK